MIRDGNGAVTGTTVRDFYGGHDRCIRGTDDLLILPLQSGTQWDALAHIVFDDQDLQRLPRDGRREQGRDPQRHRQGAATASSAAACCSTSHAARGVPWLEPGEPIHAADLEACARRHRA